jgi:hypothetical protein
MTARRDGVWLAAFLNTLIAIAGCVVLVHHSNRDSREVGGDDLHDLTESMLVDESVVPPLAGTTWGSIVAVPQGAPAPVRPPECALFLSQGDASQKAVAMRSSQGAAIGVELAIKERAVDLAAVRDTCAHFTMDVPGVQSAVRVETTCIAGLAAGAISTLLHSTTTTEGRTVAWEVAMIAGFHRGVLVTAEYTPGPGGGPFDREVAAKLPALFAAQIHRLDAS